MRPNTTSLRVSIVGAVLLVSASCPAAGPHRPPHNLAPKQTPAGHDPVTSRIAPYAGHANHSLAQPTFRWGWFGAEHFYPEVQWHRDYNGEVVRWTKQRRY
ncbi:MAG: hypothetical protein ACRCT8_17760 [Lacipirellulaceae bacterium]